MKFIPVSKARNIKFGETIIGQTAAGEVHRIRAVSKSEDANGVNYVWEFAAYKDEDNLDPVFGPTIVSVCVIKQVTAAPDPANVDNLAFNG